MREEVKVAVCEDEEAQREYIRALVSEWAQNRGVSCRADGYVSAEQLIYSLDGAFPYQIYILDIQMGKMNGMELARKIRSEDSQAAILFLTGLKDYALEGYEVGAVRYLIKPVKKEELFGILDEAAKRESEADVSCFLLERNGGVQKIPYKEIWYVEAQGHYLEMAYGDEKVQWKASFGSVQERFTEQGFVLTRRGVLVNLCRIARVEKTECVLDNGERVSVSRNQYKAVNEAFIRYYKI